MKFISLMVLLNSFVLLAGEEPQITLSYQNSHNFYATVAGQVIARKATPFLVSVENAGLKYTTITDESGHFGIVFRHLAVHYNVSAKNIAKSQEKDLVFEGVLPFDD